MTGSPRHRPPPGRRLLVGLAAAAVLALAAAGTGLLAIATLRQPAASLPASPVSEVASQSATPLPGLSIGTPELVGRQTGVKAALAETTSGPVVSVYPAQVAAPVSSGDGSPSPAGTACPSSPVGIVGASSVAWTTSDQSVLLLAGDSSTPGPVGIGFSPDCAQTTILAPTSATSWTASRAPSILAGGVWFLGMEPGHPQTVVAWSPATGQLAQKGGFESWTTDGGRTWTSGQTDAGFPAGWDASGAYWQVFPGRIARSFAPGDPMDPGSSVTTSVTWDPSAGQVPPLMASGVFRGRVLLGVRSGTPNLRGAALESVATDGSGTTRVQIAAWLISVGPRFVAVEGLDIATGTPTLAVSSDGVHFVTRVLPDEFAQAPTDSVALLALDGRVLVTDWPQTSNPADQVIHVWSVPVTGAPASPPSPSPYTTPSPTPAVAVFQPSTLAFWDPQRGLVAGSFAVPGETGYGRILRTADGGRTWTTVDSPPEPVSELWVAGTIDAWALTTCVPATNPCARLLHSTDGGRTWTSRVEPFDWVAFGDSSDGWAAAPGPGTMDLGLTVSHTTDGGATWAKVTSPCQGSPAGPLRAIAFGSPSSGLAVCANTLGAGGEFHSVLSTSDGGVTWHVRASVTPAPSSGNAEKIGDLPYGGYIRGIVVAADGTAWLWGDRMDVLASTDGGVTWRGLGLTGDGGGMAVPWPLDAQHGFVLLGDPNRQATLLEATTDGGHTWQELAAWPDRAPGPPAPAQP